LHQSELLLSGEFSVLVVAGGDLVLFILFLDLLLQGIAQIAILGILPLRVR
jgi:hypothetical protein